MWNPIDGNVILVSPMGKESYRGPDTPPDIADLRTIAISSPTVSMSITAPNGANAGALSIAGEATSLVLNKNVKVSGSLGTVTLSINASSLILGKRFEIPTFSLPCRPTIDGAQPPTWDYKVIFSFDGTTLKAEIGPLSVGLSKRSVGVPLPSLSDSEEVIIVAPTGGLILRATTSAPQSSAKLGWSFPAAGH